MSMTVCDHHSYPVIRLTEWSACRMSMSMWLWWASDAFGTRDYF